MRAARFYAAKEPLRIEEVEARTPGESEVRGAVEACGICGTDPHVAIEGTIQLPTTPIVLGHEAAGVVAAVGPGVTRWKAGALAVDPEHLRLGAQDLAPLPDEVSFPVGAIVADAVSTAYR